MKVEFTEDYKGGYKAGEVVELEKDEIAKLIMAGARFVLLQPPQHYALKVHDSTLGETI